VAGLDRKKKNLFKGGEKELRNKLLTLIVVLILASPIFAWTDGNLVVNGDMSMDWDKNGLPDYWSINWIFATSPNKAVMDKDENIDGNASLKIEVSSLDVPNNFAGRAYQDIPVEPGKTYEVSVWMKIEDWQLPQGQEEGGVNISYWLQGTNKQWTERKDLTRPLTGTFDWREIKATITIPAKTQAFRLALFAYPGTGTIWFDNVKMIEAK
jgi:hypothetical protein